MQPAPQRAPKAFISYKWESDDVKAWVERFAHDLRRNGIDAFLDVWEVGYGDSFIKYMTRNIPTADIFFFVMTPASIASVMAEEGEGGAVSFEYEVAQANKLGGRKLRFVPVLLRGDKPAAFLAHTRYVDLRDPSRYEKTFASLLADLTGRKKKPPLLGVGALEHELRVYRLLKAEEVSPIRKLMAQLEPYVGFPFFDQESDHPSHWPPRVYEDREVFSRRIVEFMTGQENASGIAAALESDDSRLELLSSATPDPDEAQQRTLVTGYVKLRQLFNYTLQQDVDALRERLGPETTERFLRLEQFRRADDARMPNRLATIGFRHSHGLDLEDVAIELQIVGAVYDIVLNGRRLGDGATREALGGARAVLHAGPVPGASVSTLRIWYHYIPVEERAFPDRIHLEAERTQGVLLRGIGVEGSESVERKGLIGDAEVYEEFQLKPRAG